MSTAADNKGTHVRSSLAHRPQTECLELHLVGRVDDESANVLCEGLTRATHLKQPVILLYIHSPGGFVAAGKRIIDAMNVYRAVTKGSIHTHVAVEAKSMAAVLFLCGDVRTMCTQATLMLHQVSMTDVVACKKTATDTAATSAYHTHLNLELFRLIADRCETDVEGLKRKAYAQDWYIYATEAASLKMAHKIVQRSPYMTLEVVYKIDIVLNDDMDMNSI
ncbi:hypothetical protein CYMTET_44318 [Cymbomonas tetramitiformis]|uniref:ATP-dependent Clp protease proteolytic subunit n=1 Tax=Cymbomonas tetramitiformis TaxID=36881 RepID=A0AAE0EZP1_9CHLO|nr:hypothetical protein CYMTET_44318 [Cymbomonas tetramitiformis]|eukprot:gene832-1309_t